MVRAEGLRDNVEGIKTIWVSREELMVSGIRGGSQRVSKQKILQTESVWLEAHKERRGKIGNEPCFQFFTKRFSRSKTPSLIGIAAGASRLG